MVGFWNGGIAFFFLPCNQMILLVFSFTYIGFLCSEHYNISIPYVFIPILFIP